MTCSLRSFQAKQRPAFVAFALALGAALFAGPAAAIPELQLYIEGATYVGGSEETWVYDGTGPIRLWAIGNVNGPGGHGPISDVHLSIAYSSAFTPTFTLVSSTTGGYGGYVDPSTPVAAVLEKTVTDGSVPKLSDGSSLPSHGQYGSGVSWQQFSLGSFSLQDSQIEDFITSFPVPDMTTEGQINVYEISATGLIAGAMVHFDLYNSVQAGTRARATFAPFSHDATGDGFSVPEPGTLASLGAGLIGIALFRRRIARCRIKGSSTRFPLELGCDRSRI